MEPGPRNLQVLLQAAEFLERRERGESGGRPPGRGVGARSAPPAGAPGPDRALTDPGACPRRGRAWLRVPVPAPEPRRAAPEKEAGPPGRGRAGHWAVRRGNGSLSAVSSGACWLGRSLLVRGWPCFPCLPLAPRPKPRALQVSRDWRRWAPGETLFPASLRRPAVQGFWTLPRRAPALLQCCSRDSRAFPVLEHSRCLGGLASVHILLLVCRGEGRLWRLGHTR